MNEKEKVMDGKSGEDEGELIWLWGIDGSGRERWGHAWLTKWARKLILGVRWCVSKWAIC